MRFPLYDFVAGHLAACFYWGLSVCVIVWECALDWSYQELARYKYRNYYVIIIKKKVLRLTPRVQPKRKHRKKLFPLF